MLNPLNRRVLASGLIAGVLAGTVGPAFAEQKTRLFTIVTEKGEIVVALTKEDGALGSDAAAVSKALRDRGSVTIWRYAVRKAKDVELEPAPALAKTGVEEQGTLRIEPYRTPLRIVVPE